MSSSRPTIVLVHGGWQTYVVCSAERAMPPEGQRELFAPRLNRVVEMNSSHSPFLSQPEAVADMLASEALD